ncbi:MAG: hypothetical protein ABMA02_17120 [Saprospiraceae bacterium]
MPVTLQRTGLDFKFLLVWIKEIPYQEFLKTGKAELVLMGVLADYGEQTAETVMAEGVNELSRLTPKGMARELHCNNYTSCPTCTTFNKSSKKLCSTFLISLTRKKIRFSSAG